MVRKKQPTKVKSGNWWHAHVHSEFSVLDGMSSVDLMVGRAHRWGQPAIALSEHGNMSSVVQGYKATKKYGMQYFPAIEGYLVHDVNDKDAQRYHVGLLALNYNGYKALCKLSSWAHRRENFHRFPRFDLGAMALLSQDAWNDIAVLTGCVSGMPIQTLLTKGPFDAQRVVEMYARWFPHTFVELQNHGNVWPRPALGTAATMTDMEICKYLVQIAKKLGLPTIATNDSHYCDSSDKSAHGLMKRMVYGGGTDSEFSGDSYHLATEEWVAEHFRDPNSKTEWYLGPMWEAGLQGSAHLLSLNKVSIPELDTFTVHMPQTVKNPSRWLHRAMQDALVEFFAKNNSSAAQQRVYNERVDYELDIIDHLKMAAYFALFRNGVVEWCEDKAIFIEARGSANGSLVAFLLGITQVDPIKWGLLFERFLSKDRKKPPDIDMDVEDAGRDRLVAQLERTYGTTQIGTYGSLGARELDDKGSALVTYNMYLRKKHGENFSRKFGRGVETVTDVKRISSADYLGLRGLTKSNVKRSYGVHAAGLLLSGEHLPSSDIVPTMLVASSGTTVTQYTMDDVEELGFLKLDILGQRTLTAMTRCLEYIGRDPADGFEWIPLDDRPTFKDLRSGRPNTGVFQFEGYSTALGGKELGIKSIHDVILCLALYRPACINSGWKDIYIERRRDPSQRAKVKYPHPAFEKHLKETFGVVLFQEQVINVMRELGLSYEGINTFFKAVKDSGSGATDRNVARFKEVRKEWAGICSKNGITDPDAAWVYIEGYTQYGFNKAHATGYGLRSYRAQYLKTHYPLEYMAAVLSTTAGHVKEPGYIKEARVVGVRLLPPDVNVSGPVWTIDKKRNAIRKGLASIKGVGFASANEIHNGAPYADMEDLVTRVTGRSLTGGIGYKKDKTFTGALLALRDAGALQSLGVSRGDE